MKKTFFILGAFCISSVLISWGIFGHEHINKSSVMALPQPMQTFFYNHIDYVTQESTVPDLRKYTLADRLENPRHFIDLENYGAWDSLPKTMKDAKAKYDDKFLTSNGILPWFMEEMTEKLTKAFKEKRKTDILFIAADLGHYMGDAHMPLHTSANFDGQMTNQKGIHALWEAQLPEKYGNTYSFNVPEAKFIDNVHNEIWRIIAASNKLKDSLLTIDNEIRKGFTEDKILKKDAEGKVVKNKFGSTFYSDEYAEKLNTALKGMVERQLRKSIIDVSNLWYTAWVNAGKPDLTDLDSPELTKRNQKHYQEDLELWKKGKLYGMDGEKDF